MSGEADGIGTIFTGGIAAQAVERAINPGGGAHNHAGVGGSCLNCGTIRAGEFCQACGQSGHVHRHIMAIGHDILHGVFHFEGKFWSTLPMLIRRPGELTRRYVHGERVRFVSPMALFLFSVFLLFAAVNRIVMPDVAGLDSALAKAREQITDRTAETAGTLEALKAKRAGRLRTDPAADVADLDRDIAATQRKIASLKTAAAQVATTAKTGVPIGTVSAAGTTYNFDAKSLENVDVDTGSRTLDRQLNHVKENPALYAYKLKMASYKYSWALIPISVPFIWLMFCWRRDVGLFDHAIFAIYSLSFMTLLVVGLIGLSLIGVGAEWLWLALLIAPPIHMYKQLKAAYLLSRASAAWRTAVLLLTTSVAGAIFFAMLIWLEAD